jgi:hypothetical protein
LSLCRECGTEVQEWWAKYLEEMPLPTSIVPEEMRDDPWLESHFHQLVEDEILGK